jgi:superfamily II RNA helicase
MVKICNTPYSKDSEYNNYFEQYPYPLSDFQKYAIQGIVEGHSVLVTAHTGSGKTLPALFAIDLFVKQGKKVIYTSPIKALSNQKYWEFTQKFPHIQFGLLTGDIKTNPAADVLIMTTEILMNYLFRKTTADFSIDIENELGCVIFDEVHYINDRDRGHVWEQTILMLPPFVQMVLLSATIDQPQKFGEWIEEKKGTKSVWLCSTETRVVPLTHYSFLTINEGIFKGIKDDVVKQEIRNHTNKLIPIKTDKGVFLEPSYHSVKKMLTLFENKGVQWVKRKFVVHSLLTFLKDREMLPAILFVFSRKQVELLAQEITLGLFPDDSKLPYTISHECEQILRSKMTNYREYLELPEYTSLVKLLEKGVGIHHSGMIPILREIVELFISKKYIQVLIATESFAIGLDCPIKTAVFISLTKYDGDSMRLLLPHEYNQMSGRAGRRGIDTIGHVIHCNNLFPLPSLTEYRELLCGPPQKLTSKFSVSYSVLFSLMNTSDGKTTIEEIEEFVKKSMVFREIQISLQHIQTEIMELEQNLEKKKEYLRMLKTPEEVMVKYRNCKKDLEMASNKKRKELMKTMTQMTEEYRYLEKDMVSYSEKEEIVMALEKKRLRKTETEQWIRNQIVAIVSILEKQGFIVSKTAEGGRQPASFARLGEEGKIHYTELGKIASHFAEVHPLVFSKQIQEGVLNKMTAKQLVGLLSCFTNIRLESDKRATIPQTKDSLLLQTIGSMQKFLDSLEQEQHEKNLQLSLEEWNFDCIDEMMEWCDCNDEVSCKYLIQTKIIGEKEISIGDFVKAILKIVAIVNEIEKGCLDNVELLYTCSFIKPMILKYITTSQSLYI